MTIKLDDEFTLESDINNWTLKYCKEGDINPETGKPTITKWESYHGDLKFALIKYLNSAPKDAGDVLHLMKRINDVENRILNLKTKKL